MNLNDPFARVARRSQRDYQAMCDRLREEGIQDAEAVAKFAGNMSRLALRLTVIILGLSLLLVLVFPHLQGIFVALGMLALLWISVSYFRTRMHLKKYRQEECVDR